MKLLVERLYKKKDYTIGKLYIDGEYLCDTLEDTDRGFTSDQFPCEIRKLKVAGKSAIPTGTYVISLSVYSTKFGAKPFYKRTCGGRVPRLLDVPGFSGVLIHCGNDNSDTEGCILLGYNTEPGIVTNSQKVFEILMDKIRDQKAIYLTIK